MPTEYARDNLGRYQTDGLSAKDFNKVFDLIRKQQRQNRRNARRTLTPRIMGMRNRELEAFLSLGKKKDGTYFTPEDIRSFNTSRQAHKTKFKSTVTRKTPLNLRAIPILPRWRTTTNSFSPASICWWKEMPR